MGGTDFIRDFIMGGTIGAVSKTIMSPVERVKILMQTMDSNPRVVSGEIKPYCSIADCFRRVSKEQGVAAFWRGNLVNCLRYAPQQGSALVICYPLDFARTRLASDLQAGKGQFNGIVDCIAKTVRQQGLTGLYRGTAVSIAGAFVYRAGQLGLYGTVMGLNPYQGDKGIKGLASAIVVATAARTVVLPFNYPFDTVRRRLMLESEKPKAERLYKSGIHCSMEVLKKEGLKGLYKGMFPEIFRGFGGVMVVVLYDRVKNYLGLNKK